MADITRTIEDRLLPLVRQPHELGGVALPVSCSVGVAIFPDDGEDIETLMQNADTAMYQAKGAGRDLVKFFAPDMAERARFKARSVPAHRARIARVQTRVPAVRRRAHG